jgi:hypothetical protein
MPNPAAILESLTLASRDSVWLAIAWHGITWAALLALAYGWRPSRRLAGLLLTTPLGSAAVVAFTHGNPFNEAVLGALTIVLAALAWRFDEAPVSRARGPRALAGALLVAFGLVYPHFLAGPRLASLVAAPTGLIPCPTLSLAIGFTLFAGGLGSRAWSFVLALAGLFYGLFGLVRLGVALDAALVAGAATLLATTVRARGTVGDTEALPPTLSSAR